MLEPDGKLLVGARDHGGSREALGDLLRVIRPGEHGHGPALHDVGEPEPVSGSSPFVRLDRRVAGEGICDRARKERLGTARTTSSASATGASSSAIAATAERSASGM